MKIKAFTIAMLLCATTAWGKNTTKEVSSVSGAVKLTEDVDYVITDASPFGAMGSVDIENTEHAVLIIKKVKPSKVISNWLENHVYINGEQAVNGKNCQVKMFNRGAIVFPYASDIKPLTCYTEENYGGESNQSYTEGSSGGFMKTLTKNNLNNNIRSFKLKRGYMVTFAVGTGGWGYSRCFIADMEDLEIPNVPAPLNGRISSYRLFKWYNASKAGVHDTSKEANDKLNTTSCFDWAQGNESLLPDVEWVPNHIYEDWPSASTCGGVTGSCHMKTNNEPGNSSDDHPQDVATVLDNWQNLMRTGMRLCSESSHDGSMNHLKQFITEIDKRGWRCDILDLHCYWNAGTFNSLNWYSDEYGNGRPIWISEWVWGSSWGHNGFWGAVSDPGSVSEANQKVLYDNTKPILDVLNSNPRVERYYYWNSEAAGTHIWHDGKLTKLGEYYAKMETGLAYNAQNEYVPKIVYSAPSDLSGSYTKKNGKVELNWTDPNGDMLDSIVVEYKGPGDSKFEKVGDVELKDKSEKEDVKYSFVTSATETGLHTYQVKEYYTIGASKKNFTTSTYTVTIAAANSVGLLQYGQLSVAGEESTTADLVAYEEVPYIVMGLVSNQNTKNGISNQIQAITKTNFKFRYQPWQLNEPVSIDKPETVDYIVLPKDTVIEINDKMMLMSQTVGKIKDEVVHITFPKAYPTGITPIVVASTVCSAINYPPVTVKISNITNEGLDIKLARQEGITNKSFMSETVNYFACSPGQASIGGGKLLSAGVDNETFVYGSATRKISFYGADNELLHLINPYIVAGPQTDNYPVCSVFRMSTIATSNKDDDGLITSRNVKRQLDGTATNAPKDAQQYGDHIGYIILSDDPNGSADDAPVITAISDVMNSQLKGFAVSTHGGVISCDDKDVEIYNAAGQRVMPNKKVTSGVYIIKKGKQSKKIIVND